MTAAGAGVKPGFSHGATDELGHKAVEDVSTIHDLHAIILHLLGLDHERLSYYHNGIERRLTDVHGQVIKGILSSKKAGFYRRARGFAKSSARNCALNSCNCGARARASAGSPKTSAT